MNAETSMQAPAVYSSNTQALVLDNDSMQSMMNMADFMSKGKATIPMHFRGNPSDCLAVVMQAIQWKMNPYSVAQKTHVVNGILGYEAQLVNAVITSLAPTTGRINYEWFGDWTKVIGKFKEITSKKKVNEDTGEPQKYRVPDWNINDEKGLGVKVWATMKGEDKPRELVLELSQCRVRNSPLWADDPRQQIAYLAVKRWSRLHCPDVIMGVYSRDELEEVDSPAPQRIQPDPARDLPAEFPEDRFKTAFPSYKKGIESGRKTHAEVIATIETKWTLTEDQKKEINAIKGPAEEAEAITEQGEPQA